MTTLAEAFVKIRPDVSKLGPELESKTESAGVSAGRRSGGGFAKSFIKATAGLAAAGAVVSFFKGSIDEGNEAIKVGAQTTAVLKSTGGAAKITATQIGTLANAISLKTGIDDEAIQSNENLLLTFTNVRNEVGKGNDIFNRATQTITDMSVALGQDGKSSAIQLGKALNDPIKGITALSRVGVTFDAQQKAAIKTAVKHGDTLKAQKIILAELTKEFGGSAAAVATPGEKMKVAWKNLQEEVGLKLIPVINNLIPLLMSIIAQVMPIVGAIANWVSHNQTLSKVLIGVIAGVWALNAALAANPIGLVVLAIAGLVAGIVFLATKTRFFQTGWNAAWGGIKAAFAATMGFLRGNLTGLVLLILGPVGALAYLALHWKTVWGGIKTAFVVTVKFLRGLFADLVGVILGTFGAIIHGAATAFGWVPGVGGKLKKADSAFKSFAASVDKTLRGIDTFVPINIHATFTATAQAAGYLGHHARGGYVNPGDWSWVGENGPELVQAGRSGLTVKSNSASMAMTSSGGGWAGGGSVHFHFHGPVAGNKKAVTDMVVAGYNDAKRTRRIRP